MGRKQSPTSKTSEPEEVTHGGGVERATPVFDLQKPVSIKDIARAANVSYSTVSRALQNSPLVGRKTTEKIQRIAQQSHYRASAVARSLVTSKTRTIGVVVTTVSDPFVAEVVAGIEEMAESQRYSVFLANCNADPVREARVVDSFEERRVDGIIVMASRVGALYMPHLLKMKIPIVLLNNFGQGEFVYSVGIDNLSASRDAVAHLIRLGHRRIAYIGDHSGFQSDTDRFGGYRQALQQADIPFQPELVAHGDGKPAGGEQGMYQILSLSERPTAVFCYNDMSALGALRAARSQKLRVPEDISLIGFDDLFLASYAYPPLTTVRQPMAHMGRLATEIVLKLLSGASCEFNLKVPGELIVRESTAPPPASASTNADPDKLRIVPKKVLPLNLPSTVAPSPDRSKGSTKRQTE
jgi:LacI family repressor for deo operon, udp, cdd, tsx, nupC, and nupG